MSYLPWHQVLETTVLETIKSNIVSKSEFYSKRDRYLSNKAQTKSKKTQSSTGSKHDLRALFKGHIETDMITWF